MYNSRGLLPSHAPQVRCRIHGPEYGQPIICSEIFQYFRIGADHFALIHSCPPDVKSWTTFFTNFYFRSAATSRRKSLIFLDIPPFFSLAVYFFALIFIFTADDLGSSPFSIIKESSFNLFLWCTISLQDSISIFSKILLISGFSIKSRNSIQHAINSPKR